jgi:hypothetical protein
MTEVRLACTVPEWAPDSSDAAMDRWEREVFVDVRP